jgi:hypothetical protein
MKDAEFTVEFIRHVLANGRGPNGERDVFERDGDDALIFHQAWWYSAYSKAIQGAAVRGVKPGDIDMDLSVRADTAMWNRHYGPGKSRLHEAIMPGTQVTFQASVADRITESNLTDILTRMGKYVGISPYGHKLGFGRFRVVEVKVSPSDVAQEV